MRNPAPREQLHLGDVRLMDSLAQPVWVHDADGKLVAVNRPFREYFAVTDAQALAGDRQLPIHREDAARYLTAWSTSLQERRPLEQQIRVRRGDGEWRWVEVHSNPRFGESGALIAFVGSIIDITERKQGEEAQAILGAIVDAADDAIVSKTLDGVIRSWNTGAERLFGYTAAEAIGRSITMIIPPELHQEERAILSRLRLGERIEHFETVRVTKDGRRLDISLTVSPVRDREGRIVGASKIARNITDRKQADRAQALLASIVASSDDAIVSKTLDGVVLSWNGAAERLFGYTAEEMIGQPIATIIPQERLDEERQIIARLRRGERIDHFETVRVTKDGRRLDISLTVSPVRDSAGRILGASKVARDITERKRAEEMLRESTEALERAHNELERFVSIASHDLKEPLRGMSMVASLLLEEETAVTQEGRARLERLRVLCERLTGMINGLLEYARAGGDRLNEPCDMERVVRSAIDKIADELEAQGAEVVVRGPLPTISGDPLLLERLFGNLIVNGITHNASPHKRVEIGCEGPNIYVRDNGVGIEPRHHEKIFGLFRRVRSDGRGERVTLGLSLVHNIVRSHRGKIWVQSEPGQGSTFYLHLPGGSASRQSSPAPVSARGENACLPQSQ
jgi:PAS domain S-box-containing protein